MIRIAVVEDDAGSIDRVLAHLDHFQRSHGERFHVAAFHDGADILEDYRPDWDIILLDIQMSTIDGMTAAKRIREVDAEVIIVFVTASPQYAIVGYEVNALSYLLKPVTYAAFEHELSRCLTRLRAREGRQLLVTAVDGDRHRVSLDDVLFMESARHRVVVHTLDFDLTIVSTMKSLESSLVDEGFHRCNSGYLVNLRHVTGVEANDCRIRGGRRVQISRPRKKDFLAALTAYISARGVSA